MQEEKELRFVADLTVGRLAKWLRVLGYDTLFLRSEAEALRSAREEGRVLLTRDRGLLRHPLVTSGRVRALFLSSDDPWGQVRQVVEEMGLSPSPSFSRCIRCNEALRPVDKEAVRERVPPFVYQGQEEFRECPRCRRLYWKGTHWHNMEAEVRRLLEPPPAHKVFSGGQAPETPQGEGGRRPRMSRERA